MDLLNVMFIILAILSLASIFSLFYKNGKLLINKHLLYFTAFLIVLLGYMSFTSLPSNFIIDRFYTCILSIVGIVGFIFQLTKKKLSLIARIMISISIVGNFYLIFL